ncbi:MAG TPA: hypothetical protein VN324_06000 [Quisquiliibacterium sp.]|nr:hypothetical protein [Quisquiliibacterium sp.]
MLLCIRIFISLFAWLNSTVTIPRRSFWLMLRRKQPLHSMILQPTISCHRAAPDLHRYIVKSLDLLLLTRRFQGRFAALAIAGLAACLSGCASSIAALGEPSGGVTLVLTVNGENYEVHRSYAAENAWSGDPLVVPRSSAPAGCAAARFFLNDVNHELRVAEPEEPASLAASVLPRPGPGFPPCSLLVSYGEFAGPPTREGLFVTGTDGLVGEARREAPHPAYYALAPFEAVAEVWLFAGAVLATPALVPGGLLLGHADSERQQKKRAHAEAALPSEVVACWRAVDHAMNEEGGGPANPGRRFASFAWRATKAGAYLLTPGAATFSADPPVNVDAQVTLRLGRVTLRGTATDLTTDAEFDCGLVAGTVVASRIRLRE